jgi:hypothetical protein
MNYKTHRSLIKHASQLGYRTAAQFAKFLRTHHHLMAVQR